MDKSRSSPNQKAKQETVEMRLSQVIARLQDLYMSLIREDFDPNEMEQEVEPAEIENGITEQMSKLEVTLA